MLKDGHRDAHLLCSICSLACLIWCVKCFTLWRMIQRQLFYYRSNCGPSVDTRKDNCSIRLFIYFLSLFYLFCFVLQPQTTTTAIKLSTTLILLHNILEREPPVYNHHIVIFPASPAREYNIHQPPPSAQYLRSTDTVRKLSRCTVFLLHRNLGPEILTTSWHLGPGILTTSRNLGPRNLTTGSTLGPWILTTSPKLGPRK